MWDLLADPTNATQIFGDMPEPKHCIFLFVAGLYAGRMPFKVAKDVNQVCFSFVCSPTLFIINGKEQIPLSKDVCRENG
jgi:hypothetical protein